MKTKNRKVFRIIFIIIGICLMWILTGYYINNYYINKVHNKPKMYVYQNFWGVVNPVLYVKEKQYIDSLVTYYQKIENGKTNPIFNFPPLTLPNDTEVYILGYERDSMVAKIISFYDWEEKGTFVKGYVYIKTLHKTPSYDTLILDR